jgi:hypothetical protein
MRVARRELLVLVKNDVGKPTVVPEKVEIAVINVRSESRNKHDAAFRGHEVNRHRNGLNRGRLEVPTCDFLSERGYLNLVRQHGNAT